MRYRLLFASLVALLALSSLTVSASAAPPTGTATVSFEANGCSSVTVTYEWSGFRGRGLIATFGVVQPLLGGAELWLFVWVEAKESGAASHTFDLTGRGAHTYYGGGRLADWKGRILSGSDVRSSTSADLSC